LPLLVFGFHIVTGGMEKAVSQIEIEAVDRLCSLSAMDSILARLATSQRNAQAKEKAS